MTVLFPDAPVAIVAMTATMEAAKLVTAGWLARRWRSTAWICRLALAGFVLGLAIINAGGTYSQLVAAHVGERGAAATAIETQDAEIAARIEVASHAVADLDARVSQIDSAVAAATQRGRTTGAMSIMDAQRRSRAGLVHERNQAAGALAALKAERASVAARGRQIETEAAPIRYVAELINAGGDDERAIRWLIAPHGVVLRSTGDRPDGRDSGMASLKVMSDEDREGFNPHDETVWVSSWEAALALFDRYPWASFYPLRVHPDFAERIWAAVQDRLSTDNHRDGDGHLWHLKDWHRLCSGGGRFGYSDFE